MAPSVTRTRLLPEHARFACARTGIVVIAVPPGDADVAITHDHYTLNLNLGRVEAERAIGSDRMSKVVLGGDSFAWAPPEVDMRFRVRNADWSVHIEVPAEHLLAEIENGGLDEAAFCDVVDYRWSPELAQLARMFVRQAHAGVPAGLFAGTVAHAILAGGLEQIGARGALVANAAGDAARRGRLARAIDWIEANLASPFTVGDVAGVASYSPDYFGRVFREVTGQTAWAYVRGRRLARARELITSTTLPIGEVAHLCGFAQQGHLATLYRNEFGLAPHRDRRG